MNNVTIETHIHTTHYKWTGKILSMMAYDRYYHITLESGEKLYLPINYTVIANNIE